MRYCCAMQGPMKLIKIGPGEYFVTRQAGDVIATVLGSCVCACIRDPLAGIGGMNHFMLPESSTGQWGPDQWGVAETAMRYGNFAMARLINDILCGGGVRERLEIKVFGGAAMVGRGGGVGAQNADFIEAYLGGKNLGVAAHHLRGAHARRIDYWPLSGIARMLELPFEPQTAPASPPHATLGRADFSVRLT